MGGLSHLTSRPRLESLPSMVFTEDWDKFLNILLSFLLWLLKNALPWMALRVEVSYNDTLAGYWRTEFSNLARPKILVAQTWIDVRVRRSNCRNDR